MRRWTTLALIVACAALLAPHPAGAAGRGVSARLLDHLRAESVTPPLPARAPIDYTATGALATPYVAEGASPDSRVVLSFAGPARGRVEQRDALVFRLPRRFRFSLDLPPEARLDFALRWVGPATPGRLRVTVEDAAGRTSEGELPLPRSAGGETRPWHELSLPLGATGPAMLEIAFLPEARGAEKSGALIAWGSPAITGRVPPPPGAADYNVLLLVLDAVRGDVLGPGRILKEPVAPHVETLMSAGGAFPAAFSPSNGTRSSTLAFLQSQPPSVGGFWTMYWTLKESHRARYHRSDPPLLTRRLAAAGWRVSTVGQNHFLFLDRNIALDHGFDDVLDVRGQLRQNENLSRHALDYAARHRDERWLLMVNYVSAHTPYEPPKGYQERVRSLFPEGLPAHIPASYLGELAYIDDHVATLLEGLQALGLRERTIIVVTADHGEVFSPAHACRSANFEMLCHGSHGMTLYDEELHVPLSFTLPDAVPAGVAPSLEVSLLDLAPTLLDYLGLPAEPRHVGRSLRPLLEGRALPPRPIYAEGKTATALREDGLKLILHHRRDDTWTPARTGGGAAQPMVQLFDLRADPGETRNLALREDPRLGALKARLEDLRLGQMESARGGAPAPEGGEALPVAPHEAAEAEDGGAAHNTLALVDDGHARRLEALLSVEAPAVLRCAPDAPEGSCRALSDTEIEIRLASGPDTARAGFESLPWSAGLQVVLNLDGEPLSPERLRVGAHGLALLGPGADLDQPEGLRLAAAASPPLLPATEAQPAAYFWRSLPRPGLVTWRPWYDDDGLLAATPAEEESLDAAMSEDLRGVLAALGYAAPTATE